MKQSTSFIKLCAIAVISVSLCATPFFVKAQSLDIDEIIGHLTDNSKQQTYRYGAAALDLLQHFNKAKFEEIKKQVKQTISKDQNLRLGIRFFMYERVAMQEMGLPDPEVNRRSYLRKLAEANSLEDKQLLSDLCVKYANLCASTEKLYYLLKCVRIREDIGTKYFSDISSNYYYISELLYRNADYKNAAYYANKAAKLFTLKDKYLVNYILLADIAGSSNLKINRPDIAYAYYKDIETRVIKCIAFKFASCKAMNGSLANIWLGVAKGGMARSLMLKGNDAEAYPLLLKNLRSSQHYQQWGDVALAQNSLAQLEFKQLKIKNALSRYLEAHSLASAQKQLPVLLEITKGLTQTYAKLKLFENAYLYQQQSVSFKAQLDSLAYKTRLDFVGAKVAFDNVNEEFKNAQDHLRQQKRWRIFIMISIVICTAIVMLVFYSKELRSRLLLANAKRDMQKLMLEQGIVKKEISNFADKIVEKNQLINDLKEKINIIESTEAKALLENYTILTTEDWMSFKRDFEKVYPRYIERMIKKIPNITLGEQRILLLAKLDLSNKEMASAMGVSTETVRSVVSRFRKKVALNQDIYTIAEGV